MISIWFFFSKKWPHYTWNKLFQVPWLYFQKNKKSENHFSQIKNTENLKEFFFFDFIARQSRNNLMYHHHSSIGEEFCLSEFSFRLNRWFFSIIFHFRTNIHAYTHLERLPSQVNNVFQMKEKNEKFPRKREKHS